MHLRSLVLLATPAVLLVAGATSALAQGAQSDEPALGSEQLEQALATCTDRRSISYDEKVTEQAKAACAAVIRSPDAADSDKFMAYMGRGRIDYYDEDPDGALEDFEGAVQLRPDSAEAHYWRGQVVDADDALKAFDTAIALDPNMKQAHLARGRIFLGAKDYEEAARSFGTAIEIDPEYTVAYPLRGKAYQSLNRDELALADYDKALALAPDNDDAIEGKKTVLMARARSFFDAGQFGQAVTTLDAALEFDPDWVGAHSLQGQANAGMGQFEQAVSAYDAAISADPDAQYAYVLRGETYYGMGQYERALADFDKVLALDRARRQAVAAKAREDAAGGDRRAGVRSADLAARLSDPSPNAKRAGEGREKALCHLNQDTAGQGACDAAESTEETEQASLGKPDAQVDESEKVVCSDADAPQVAIANCSTVIEGENPTAATYYVRGRAYVQDGQFDVALADFELVFQMEPSPDLRALAHFWRAQAYWGKKQLADALKDYDAVLEIRPDFVMAYYGRGRLHGEMGQGHRAMEDLDEAIRIDPRHYGARLYRGFAYMDRGEFARAVGDFDVVIEIEPVVSAYEERAKAHLNLQQYERAVEDLDGILALNPEHDVARDLREKLVNALAAARSKGTSQ
jgi:tetratricopeptide (TPR) repeat protein